MTQIKILTVSLSMLFLAACGSTPAETQTTTTSSVQRSSSGAEVRRSSTETHEIADDGSQTTDRTETTETSTPPSE